MTIVNGRRVNVSSISNSGVYGSELISSIGNRAQGNRRAVIQKGGVQFDAIDENRKYYKHDLQDKYGNGVKISDMPDRTKGDDSNGQRTPLSKQIIKEQVYNLSEKLFKQGLDWDEDDANWVLAYDYILPSNWHHIAEELISL